MAPDEFLLLTAADAAPDLLERLRSALDGRHALVADVSDMRAMLRIEGEGARDVLSKLTPADMSPRGLPTGRVRRTRVGQAAAAIWLDETGATLICFRSVADYMFDLLADAADPASAIHQFRHRDLPPAPADG
jgi:sarcosine oxidase subunit gamma